MSPLSEIKCLKRAAIRCRLDNIWYQWLRFWRRVGIPCRTQGGDFLQTILALYPANGELTMDRTAIEYLGNFVTRRGFKIPDPNPGGTGKIRVEGRKDILAQFTKGPPGIAKEGFIQLALSYWAERYVLDITTGEVMVCRSPMLSHELYEWDKAGRTGDLGQVTRGCAAHKFDNLGTMFRHFETPEEAGNKSK